MAKGKRVVEIDSPDFSDDFSLELVAKAIRARRTQLGLDIKSASMLCGVSLVTLSKIEKGSSGVRFESVLKVASALGIKFNITPWN